MSGFYNYDTRGASFADQIINLERMVEERDAKIERLRDEVVEVTRRQRRLRWLLREALKGPGWQDEYWRSTAEEALGDES